MGLLPPSVEEWLPQNHPARFMVDTLDQPELSAATRQCRGTDSAVYRSAVILDLLSYGCAKGAYSDRRIEAEAYRVDLARSGANEQTSVHRRSASIEAHPVPASPCPAHAPLTDMTRQLNSNPTAP